MDLCSQSRSSAPCVQSSWVPILSPLCSSSSCLWAGWGKGLGPSKSQLCHFALLCGVFSSSPGLGGLFCNLQVVFRVRCICFSCFHGVCMGEDFCLAFLLCHLFPPTLYFFLYYNITVPVLFFMVCYMYLRLSNWLWGWLLHVVAGSSCSVLGDLVASVLLYRACDILPQFCSLEQYRTRVLTFLKDCLSGKVFMKIAVSLT